MNHRLSRRDFIKLLSVTSLTPLLGRRNHLGMQWKNLPDNNNLPNIIILLFDALSARNMSLYGYARNTTPNITKFAQKAIVYHRNYCAGSYTTPSTASLFTGVYPWTHRVFHLFSRIAPHARSYNLLKELGKNSKYHRVAFTHNLLAEGVLEQFNSDIDQHLNPGAFAKINHSLYHTLFKKDGFFGLKAVDIMMFQNLKGDLAGSLVLSALSDTIISARHSAVLEKYGDFYPRGIGYFPNSIHFTLQGIMQGVKDFVNELPSPYLAYFHFFFPHTPYVADKNFIDLFKNDNWEPPEKPVHVLSDQHDNNRIQSIRRRYDEYIANVDDEFGKLIQHWEKTGVLENSYVIVTSDHGEMFERGEMGHEKPTLYEPLTQIPLIISKPNQKQRQDIHSLTNNVDLAPTILHLTGQPVPEWCEGQVLPGLGGKADSDRSVFTLFAHLNSSTKPLTTAAVAMVKGDYKLLGVFGYPEMNNSFELYNLKNDPEELNDRFADDPSTARELYAEWLAKLDEVNRPFL